MLAGILFFAGSLASLSVAGQGVVQAAPQVCQQPPNCIINGDLNPNGVPYANMNFDWPNTVDGWYISHGTPSFTGGCPVGGMYGIWMWTYSGQGEGMFSCYNFRAGHKYEVCFWVMNTTAVTAGNLNVFATTGLNAIPPVGFGAPPPVPATQQLISNTFVHSPVWTLVSYTFTANANYNQLWIYPFMAGPPVGGVQYSLSVDKITVRDVETQPAYLTITSTASTITWCEQATLCAYGAPSGNYVWSPATGLSSTTGQCVTASPCSTTTYSVSDPYFCTGCQSHGDSYTIEVVPPDIQVFSNSPVSCGKDIKLWVTPDLPCATIEWYDPQGNFIGNGQDIGIPNANPDHAGTYRVVVSYGGCSIEKFVTVEVIDCPCEFKPKFAWEGCTPIYFWDVSTGYGTSVAWFWDFGDGSTSTQQNPTHLYGAEGYYTVCLTVIRKVGKETCCDRYCTKVYACKPERNEDKSGELQDFQEPQPPKTEFKLNNPVRPAEATGSSKADISVQPNPATDQAFVTVKNMENPVVSLRSLTGTVLQQVRARQDGRYVIDLTGLAQGVYMVVAETATARQTAKLIKN